MLTEYEKAIQARRERAHYLIKSYEQHKGLTFKPSDFHNLPCKPMRIKK